MRVLYLRSFISEEGKVIRMLYAQSPNSVGAVWFWSFLANELDELCKALQPRPSGRESMMKWPAECFIRMGFGWVEVGLFFGGGERLIGE